MAQIVPIPIPTRYPSNTRLMITVQMIHPTSNIFFVIPLFLCILSAAAATIPSPGFGTNFIFTDTAAPIPVHMIAARSIRSFCHICDTSIFIYLSNILMTLMNNILRTIWNTSIHWQFFHLRINSAMTNSTYSTSVAFPKFHPT